MELLTAASLGAFPRVRELLVAGADANDADLREHIIPPSTPLYAAARGGHTATVRLLCERGARVGAIVQEIGPGLHLATALGAAVQGSHVRVVEVLVARGANKNEAVWGRLRPGDPLESVTRTPLGWAAARGLVELALLLIRCGASPSAAGSDGRAPLHSVAELGITQLVEELLCKGAPVDAGWMLWAPSQATPLILAAWGGHRDTVRILCEAKADVTAVEEGMHPDYRLDPLNAALLAGHTRSASEILHRGASPDKRLVPRAAAVNAAPLTPLLVAVRTLNVAAVKMLLDSGADPLLTEAHSSGATPLEMALASAPSDRKRDMISALKPFVEEALAVREEKRKQALIARLEQERLQRERERAQELERQRQQRERERARKREQEERERQERVLECERRELQQRLAYERGVFFDRRDRRSEDQERDMRSYNERLEKRQADQEGDRLWSSQREDRLAPFLRRQAQRALDQESDRGAYNARLQWRQEDANDDQRVYYEWVDRQ